jgi:hypothetical protein
MIHGTFAERLQRAQEAAATPLPGFFRDQLRAASHEMSARLDGVGERASTLRPDMHHEMIEPSMELMCRLMAACYACRPCIHQRGPQPGVVLLPKRLMLCVQCADAGWLAPNAIPDDACDVCEDQPYSGFMEFGIQIGPLWIVGNVADGCECSRVVPEWAA